MKHDVKLCWTHVAVILSLFSLALSAETTPSLVVKNCKIAEAWTLPNHPEIREKTWQDACRAVDLPPTDVPGGWWCVNHAGNPMYVQSGDICADSSLKIPMNGGWCDVPNVSCPNSSWTLSDDKNTCFRPDDACWKDVDNVSELKLLAAIAYGESHWSDVYEEIAGIASATIRRRDAAGFIRINELVKKNHTFSYVVYNKNERFIKLMCGDEKDFEKAYAAAANALNYGEDYSNGGCFWDGYDLKTSGVQHYKYKKGFRYTDPSHNIFSTPEPTHVVRRGDKGVDYDNIYISTGAAGRTIFWKLDENYLKAKGAIQCR